MQLVTRIWVKEMRVSFKETSVYTSSIQAICGYFEQFLSEHDDFGFCIADSRNKSKNVSVSHSIFTQKFQTSTSNYSKMLELPTFGHSDNHAGLQMCDLICSALLFPIACEAYCSGYVSNVHVQPNAKELRTKFGTRLKTMQYRFQDAEGHYKGGVVVSDPVGKQNATLMFN